MPFSRSQTASDDPRRQGFTTIEAIMVLLIVVVVVGSLMPTVRVQITHARINRAANTIAGDFLQAQSLAARQHVPVKVLFDSTAKSVTIVSSTVGDTLIRRVYGIGSDFDLTSFTPNVTSALVFPNGMCSQSVQVTISGASLTRSIILSRAGQVRIN